jgi:hypothetical protein
VNVGRVLDEYREIAAEWDRADGRARLEAAWYVCNDALALILIPLAIGSAGAYLTADVFWPVYLPIVGGVVFVVSVISVGYVPARLAAAGLVDERPPPGSGAAPDDSPGSGSDADRGASGRDSDGDGDGDGDEDGDTDGDGHGDAGTGSD